jgi:MFS family permease
MGCKHLILGMHSFTIRALPSLLEHEFQADNFRLNAIQNVGQLVALPFCAVACDKFGRRATLLFGAFLMLIGVILQGAAQNSQ